MYGSSTRRLVVVGLGNYTHPLTRHSVGQLLLENLSQHASSGSNATSSTSSGQLLLNKAYPAFVSTSRITTNKTNAQGVGLPPLEILFVKPRAQMNVSGPSIVSACKGFLPPSSPSASSTSSSNNYRIITLQDELDLPSMAYKTQRGGSARGHNGVRSLSRSLNGALDFYRIRIGVGRPSDKRDGIADWVMGALGRDEVRACEGGRVMEECWKEILRIGWEEDSVIG